MSLLCSMWHDNFLGRDMLHGDAVCGMTIFVVKICGMVTQYVA